MAALKDGRVRDVRRVLDASIRSAHGGGNRDALRAAFSTSIMSSNATPAQMAQVSTLSPRTLIRLPGFRTTCFLCGPCSCTDALSPVALS